MLNISPNRIQNRLTLITIITIIPVLVVTLLTFIEQRQLSNQSVIAEVQRLSRIVSSNQDIFTEGAKVLLPTLAQLSEVVQMDGEACGQLFTNLLKGYPFYANLGAASVSGDIYCSGTPLDGVVNASNRAWFQRAVESQSFSIGDYQIGSITHKPVLVYGYPILDTTQLMQGVVFASLDLVWLNQLVTKDSLPDGAIFVMIDSKGTILARFPESQDWIGKQLPDVPVVKAAQASSPDEIIELPGLDGTQRLYAFTQIKSETGAGEVFLTVGVPAAVAYAAPNQLLAQNIIGLLVAVVLALVTALSMSRRFILHPLNILLQTTRQLAAGETGARTHLDHDQSEFGDLARSFDNMAEALEQRQDELEGRVAERTAELQQSLLKERELGNLKSRFVSMVSHEFRTPLAIIHSSSDLLLHYANRITESRKDELLTQIESQIRRLNHLLDDILVINRVNVFGTEFKPVKLNLSDVCQHLLNERQQIAGDRFQLHFVSSGDCSEALMDEELINRVIGNLLSNAVKYTPEGGQVNMTLDCDAEQFVVRVQDSGIGISPEDQEHLFESFYRGNNVGVIPGTGLGLAIIKQAVDAHHGTIRCESKLGEGTTFIVTLPRIRPPAD